MKFHDSTTSINVYFSDYLSSFGYALANKVMLHNVNLLLVHQMSIVIVNFCKQLKLSNEQTLACIKQKLLHWH